MSDIFTIIIDNEPVEVRKLNFKNSDRAFEVRKKREIQFILVQDINKNTNRACNVGYTEYSKVNQEYIDKIVSAIESQFE